MRCGPAGLHTLQNRHRLSAADSAGYALAARFVAEEAHDIGGQIEQIMLFADHDECPEPNRLRFRMKPDDSITLTMQAKVPGLEMLSRAVDMGVEYGEQLGGEGPDAYERLIADALIGDERLFARQDGVEEAWRIVQPLLDRPPVTRLYRSGTWGPPAGARRPSIWSWTRRATSS